MKSARPLPATVSSGAFVSREVDAFGVSRERLRRRDVRRPHHGAWTVDAEPSNHLERCREWAPLMLPGQVFSHETALGLMGAPIDSTAPLHISVLFPRTPPRGSGMRGHSLRQLESTTVSGLPASTAESAWLDAAAHLTVPEVVVLADFLLTAERATSETLSAIVRARERAPGNRAARRALGLARKGARSKPETQLRLAIVLAGLPEPAIEFPIVVAGGLVLHPDLVFVRERVVLEYEGDGHRTDRQQWMRDLQRRELLEAAGWRVIRVTARDLYRDRPAFLSRLRVVLASRTR